jgi:3-methylcrotonyl-CoA carboxylase alpha subunit
MAGGSDMSGRDRRVDLRTDDRTVSLAVRRRDVPEAASGGPAEEHEVVFEDGTSAIVRIDGAGGCLASCDGRTRETVVAADGDARWVFIEGEVFRFEPATARRPRRAGAGGSHDTLAAPMPATVIRVQTGTGATVRKGDVVLVLEAMKMEMPLRAPRDGIVGAVTCREGELVQPGVPLMEIE